MQASNEIISALVELEPIKTWSLIVTLFGDLNGDRLTGKQLRGLLEPIGIKAEATRVALHRLKKDGWIVSEKQGREVSFQLSDLGIRETKLVYEDVYRQDVKHPDGWRLLLVNETAETLDKEKPHIQIGRHIVLVPNDGKQVNGDGMEVELTSEAVPEWFQGRLLPKASIEVASRLEMLATRIEVNKSEISREGAMLIRLLLLHHWRKLALRPGCWAHIAFLPEGAIAQCHKRITKILANGEPIAI